MLLQKVRSILKRECAFSDHSKFLVGVSGGPDSVCLLDILSQLPFEIVIGHLNHNLRPTSTEEMEFVEKLAAKYSLKIIRKSVDILKLSWKNKMGVEETARKERYKFLFASAQQEGAVAVMVAHQADDQVETILMNLIRGSGLAGVTGMRVETMGEFDEKIPILRPLLGVWREEIMDYCVKHQLAFKLDESNQSLTYMRTSIRNHLIPELEKYNPNIKKTLLRTRKVFEADYSFIKESIVYAAKEIQLDFRNDRVFLDVAGFKRLPTSLQRLVIKETLENHFFSQDMISFSAIESVRKMLSREIRTSSLKIREQLYVFIDGQIGILSSVDSSGQESDWPLIAGIQKIAIQAGKYPVGSDWQLEIEEVKAANLIGQFQKNQNNYAAFIDRKSVVDEFSIRTWTKGDRFRPLGMNGKTMKLSDYWINRRVPRQARVGWPLFTNQENILWIPGFQQAHETRITEKTRDVLILKLIRKNFS